METITETNDLYLFLKQKFFKEHNTTCLIKWNYYFYSHPITNKDYDEFQKSLRNSI